jgi:hypothetical protein
MSISERSRAVSVADFENEDRTKYRDTKYRSKLYPIPAYKFLGAIGMIFFGIGLAILYLAITLRGR